MYLVADIGATNARFQHVEDLANIHIKPGVVTLPTAEFTQAQTLLEAAQADLPAAQLQAALLAIAGPGNNAGGIGVTNTGLQILQRDAAAVLGCPTRLTNDFVALAHGVPYLDELTRIGGAAPSIATKALLGPGTGLGMATLVRGSGQQWQVVASEGGHADLAPGNHLEAELWGVLSAQHDHVCWETVLSGSGLQNLHAAMATLWGGRVAPMQPGEILRQGVNMDDPVCHQTLETFCALLGSAAGNLALTVAASGGVYIGGGIVPRMLDFVATSPLRRRFEERGDMSDFVRDIPLLIITQEDAGLFGAAHCLQISDLT